MYIYIYIYTHTYFRSLASARKAIAIAFSESRIPAEPRLHPCEIPQARLPIVLSRSAIGEILIRHPVAFNMSGCRVDGVTKTCPGQGQLW